MMKLSRRITLFKKRLKVAFNILFVYRHWFLVSLDSNNLRKLISEDDFEAKLLYHGLVNYNIKMICKNVVCDMDDIDWILEKAKFEADAEIHKQENI